MNTIFEGDCIEGMAKYLPTRSVNCCVTSPPYFGLRDYGHEGQIGLEETPEQFVAKLVDVFRQVKRVLKDDGTLWLNLGDSYAANQSNNGGYSGKSTLSGFTNPNTKGRQANDSTRHIKLKHGLKPKDLIGIPWMVAFALRSDGWYLRQDIIWHKPNPMPESVTDRCTKSHEYIFLLSKSQKYYYDQDAIKEESSGDSGFAKQRKSGVSNFAKTKEDRFLNDARSGNGYGDYVDEGYRNKRSVWTVTTKPYSEAHFATYPEDLIVDCIKAGCPEGGIVLDPFMGAGTTALVARKLHRQYVGFELNPEYIRIAKNRLQSQLGVFV